MYIKIYTDVAYRTCANYEGSGPGPDYPSHWNIDALTFINWGFEMIEADFCNTQGVNITPQELYMEAHLAIGNAMAITGKKVFFYQCSWGAADEEWTWSPETSNAFRNTPDICGPGHITFTNILRNFDATIIHSSTPARKPGLPGTGIGAYNDADMLGVGMDGINDIEGRTQFSLVSVDISVSCVYTSFCYHYIDLFPSIYFTPLIVTSVFMYSIIIFFPCLVSLRLIPLLLFLRLIFYSYPNLFLLLFSSGVSWVDPY